MVCYLALKHCFSLFWGERAKLTRLYHNRNSDGGNKQDQLPVLSQMCPLQGLAINYAPSSKLFS